MSAFSNKLTLSLDVGRNLTTSPSPGQIYFPWDMLYKKRGQWSQTDKFGIWTKIGQSWTTAARKPMFAFFMLVGQYIDVAW